MASFTHLVCVVSMEHVNMASFTYLVPSWTCQYGKLYTPGVNGTCQYGKLYTPGAQLNMSIWQALHTRCQWNMSISQTLLHLLPVEHVNMVSFATVGAYGSFQYGKLLHSSLNLINLMYLTWLALKTNQEGLIFTGFNCISQSKFHQLLKHLTIYRHHSYSFWLCFDWRCVHWVVCWSSWRRRELE